MTSFEQLHANRANARKNTWPITEECSRVAQTNLID